MRTVYTLPELSPVDLGDVARVKTPSIARIARGHEPNGRLSYLWTDHLPLDFMARDGLAIACPALDVVALPEVELRSDWMPYKDDAVIADPLVNPSYVRPSYQEGHVELFGYPDVQRTRAVRSPTYVVTNFNMRTYGHFLLDVIFKLLIIQQLYSLGLNYRVAFPASMSAFLPMIRASAPELRLLVYDDLREKLSLRLALMLTMPVSISGHLHQIVASAISLLSLRLAGGAPPPRRLFLSRQGRTSFRVLSNEAELADIARANGFEVLRPEALPWRDQVVAFAAASHVVGEFSSALHNTAFCTPSTKVVALNWMAPIQSAIATSVGHQIGYIMPKGGFEMSFTPGWTEPNSFEIDPGLFRDRLRQLG